MFASNGGAETTPAWYVNLIANPVVTVELGSETFEANAAVVADRAERDRLFAAHADQIDGFGNHAKQTSRVFPAVTLERLS